jgi:hypothetical protein
MKARRAILFIIVGFVLAFLFWPKKSHQQLRLKVLRRGIEQGKPVAFFRVEGAQGRRIKIIDVKTVSGNTSEGPSSGSTGLLGPRVLRTNFWAGSSPMPMFDLRKARGEFGVVAPTDAPNWTLRISVVMEGSSRFEFDFLETMLRTLSGLRSMGLPLLDAARITWNGVYYAQQQAIESEPITNSAAAEASLKGLR